MRRWWSGLRAASRIARRDAIRAKGRTGLVVAMIGLPMLVGAAGATLVQSATPTPERQMQNELGEVAQARIDEYHGGGVQQAADASGWSESTTPDAAAELADYEDDLEAAVPLGDRLVRSMTGTGTVRTPERSVRAAEPIREYPPADIALLAPSLAEGTYPAGPGEVALPAVARPPVGPPRRRHRDPGGGRRRRPGARHDDRRRGPFAARRRDRRRGGGTAARRRLVGRRQVGLPVLVRPRRDPGDVAGRAGGQRGGLDGPQPRRRARPADARRRGPDAVGRHDRARRCRRRHRRARGHPAHRARVRRGGQAQGTPARPPGLGGRRAPDVAPGGHGRWCPHRPRGLGGRRRGRARPRRSGALGLARRPRLRLPGPAGAVVGHAAAGPPRRPRRGRCGVDPRPPRGTGGRRRGARRPAGRSTAAHGPAARRAARLRRRGRRRRPRRDDLRPPVLVAGVLALEIGLVVASGGLVTLVGRLAPLAGVAGRFAMRDAARQRGRTAPAVAAIIAAMAGLVAGVVYVSSGRAPAGGEVRPRRRGRNRRRRLRADDRRPQGRHRRPAETPPLPFDTAYPSTRCIP